MQLIFQRCLAIKTLRLQNKSPKNKLKAPKMKPPKGNEKWEEEFDDEMNVGETEHGFCFLIYSIVKSL